MSTALQENTPSGGMVAAWCARPEARQKIEAALNGVMPADTFLAHMLVALQQKPEYRECSDASKIRMLAECAALGVLPTLGQVALIVYREKDGPSLKGMIQWQGYKAIMERHPDVLEVSAWIVHVSDHFAVVNGALDHRYNPLDPERVIRGVDDILGGYLTIIYRDGRPPKYHFVTAAHIAKCRECAQTKNVWDRWPEQMILKTIYRDAYARRVIPVDPAVTRALQQATEMDDVALGNQPFAVEAVARHDGRAKSDRLAERLSPPKTNGSDPHAATAEQVQAEAAAGPAGTTPTEEAIALQEYRDALAVAPNAAECDRLVEHALKNSALTPERRENVVAMCAERRSQLTKGTKR